MEKYDIYIDNPNKDFVNLNKAGCNTVRIVEGIIKKLPQNKNFEININLHL